VGGVEGVSMPIYFKPLVAWELDPLVSFEDIRSTRHHLPDLSNRKDRRDLNGDRGARLRP
jgi:hypothetical protein